MRYPRLFDFLLRDRPGDATGRRAELTLTLTLGFLVTSLWAFIYRHPVVVVISVLTSLTALLSLVQTIRGKSNFPFIFPTMVMVDVIAISLLDGYGLHDLIWMSGLGVFLLVNIYSVNNRNPIPLLFGLIIIIPFITIGLLEMNGFLPNPYGTDIRYFVLSSSLLVGVMGAITAIFHRHRTLLRIESRIREEQEHSRENLELVNRTLEEQVRSRTGELNSLNEQLLAKTARLQAAAEISQALLGNPYEVMDDLLVRATRLISEKLGYYHAGIFLLGADRKYAVLRAANSKGGQEMLAKGHQLKVGGTGIVGYVSQSGIPRIVRDTGADAIFFNNPYLPETRSEISLPIKYGNTTIGVLDVQSTQSSAFSDEDAITLTTIANQLALILRLREESDMAATPEISRRIRSLESPRKDVAYSFTIDGGIGESRTIPSNPYLDRAVASGETVAVGKSLDGNNPQLIVPVRIRDQVVGVIHIESVNENRNWTEEEILLVQAVSERAALSLENAGLFEEATRRAEQEEMISRITNQIGSSTDFERIMQTTIQELGLALQASRSFIQIGTGTPTNGGGAE